jgi:hypothetical protein
MRSGDGQGRRSGYSGGHCRHGRYRGDSVAQSGMAECRKAVPAVAGDHTGFSCCHGHTHYGEDL